MRERGNGDRRDDGRADLDLNREHNEFWFSRRTRVLTTWTKPWTAAVPIERTNGEIYEFACHEGNYGLANILSAARSEERLSGAAAQQERK